MTHFPKLKAIGETATGAPWRIESGGPLVKILATGDTTPIAVAEQLKNGIFVITSRNAHDKLLAVAEAAQACRYTCSCPGAPECACVDAKDHALAKSLSNLRAFEEKLP